MIRVILAFIVVAVVAYLALGRPHAHKGNLVTPVTSVGTGWLFTPGKNGNATIRPEGDAMRIDVVHTSTDAAQVQGYFQHLTLREGAEYQIRFEAKADHNVVIPLQALSEWNGWRSIGLDTTVALTDHWTPFTFTFVATGLDGHPARVPVFSMAANTGTIWIRNVAVEEL
jgi:hypothetical protein